VLAAFYLLVLGNYVLNNFFFLVLARAVDVFWNLLGLPVYCSVRVFSYSAYTEVPEADSLPFQELHKQVADLFETDPVVLAPVETLYDRHGVS
jgi:hypothetical protein